MGLSRNIGSAVRTRLLKGRSESIVITKIWVTLLQNKMEMNWVAVWGKHVNVMKMLYLQIHKEGSKEGQKKASSASRKLEMWHTGPGMLQGNTFRSQEKGECIR